MANRKTEQAQAEAPRQPTFDLNDPALQAIIREAVASAMAQKKSTEAVKGDERIVRAFEKAGYKNIILFDRTKLLSQQSPTILTYNRWLEMGRKVKAGEHALKIKGYHLRLFHLSQTEIMSPEVRKAEWKKRQDKEAKRAKAEAAQPSAS